MVELLLTRPGEQTRLFCGKPGFYTGISVKGMRVDFISCPAFSFLLNKQQLIPFFIMKMCLNSYAEPEMGDGLCKKRKTALGGQGMLLMNCGLKWIIKYLFENNKPDYGFSTNPHL